MSWLAGAQRPAYAAVMVPIRYRPWLWVCAWWSTHGVILAIEGMTMRTVSGVPVRDGWHALLTGLLSGWMWIPLTMLLFTLVQRYPIERRHARRRLALHAGAVMLVIVARGITVYLLDPLVHWYASAPRLHEVLIASMLNNMLTSWMIVGIAHAVLYHRRARERELQAMELESKLMSARLQALQHQLNPHFLFNALNSVSELVHHCPASADRMLVSLGHILRENLQTPVSQEVSLREELALLRQYVELEKLRLGERLHMYWDVDRSLHDSCVPRLLLQPLVENAIHHAIACRTTPGYVTVIARRLDQTLVLEVRDDGDALDAACVDGVGLSNTRARLQALYGDDSAFSLQRDAGGQETIARVVLPVRHREAVA